MEFRENKEKDTEFKEQDGLFEAEEQVLGTKTEAEVEAPVNFPTQLSASERAEPWEKKYVISICSLLVALSVLLTFVITYVILSIKYDEEFDILEENYEAELDSIGEFRSIIELYNSLPKELRNIETYKKLAYIDCYYRTNYVGKIDEEALVYMVANGYIMGVGDDYGGYYTADEFQTVIGGVEGNAVGIGVYVTADLETDGIRISYVMKDGPANQGGLLPGDIVTHVDGKSVTEVGYYAAIDMMKGEEGTSVKLVILRDGEYFEKTLIRATINVESVIYEKCETEKDVGIIHIVEFNNTTTNQFIEAVKKAIELDGCKSLVFDLRGNPGGTLSSVVGILDFMLPEGLIITQRYANGEKTEYTSDSEGLEFEALYGKDFKLAVLVNGATASAAELFTCALKDYGKAVIVGTQTYGKGCGQNVIPMYDGSGIVFTTFLYDPPKSENYNGVGITPDVVRELSEAASKKNIFDLKHDEDDQLKAALEALK